MTETIIKKMFEWHEYGKEPEEHKEIIALNQNGATLLASYYCNAWRNTWNGGEIDFNKIVCWAYVNLPRK